MDGCIFCKIIAGEIPSTKVYEDEYAVAFRDLSPQAAVHVLVVPRTHIANLSDCQELADHELAGFFRAVRATAETLGLLSGGYRVVMNAGDDACQSVHHLHAHVLGGEKLTEKMA